MDWNSLKTVLLEKLFRTCEEENNSVALISGGTSVIGRAVVERFFELGARVVICDLPNTDGEELAHEMGKKCLFVPTNIRNSESMKNTIEATEEKFGRLNYVVNCAERVISSRPINYEHRTTHPMDAFNDVLTLNVSGTFNVIRHAVPLMNKTESVEGEPKGLIINKSSIVSTDGIAGQCAYAASKGAINAMTLPLARDLGPLGIRVVSIATGIFEEPCVTLMPRNAQKALESETVFPKRFGGPEEFADMCQSVVENPMLNGVIIRLDAATRLRPV